MRVRRAAPPKPRAAYGKRARLARRRLAADGGVLNITAAVWNAGFRWWRSGNKKRTHNASEYMLVLALCLVVVTAHCFFTSQLSVATTRLAVFNV